MKADVPLVPPTEVIADHAAKKSADAVEDSHWRHSILALLMAIVFVAASAELAYAVVNVSAMPVFIPTIGLPEEDAKRWIGIIGTAFLLTEGF